jgi:hypothetical protein
LAYPNQYKPFLERFWEKVRKTDGCWPWKGAVSGGYGVIQGQHGSPVSAHRTSWLLAGREIPAGKTLWWTCGNRLCVNPKHLALIVAGDRTHMTPEERFWVKVRKTKTCWIWTGARDGNKRYGIFSAGGGFVAPHRFSFELHRSRIPKGMDVCHKCDNPSCVRPSHLFLGTPSDNLKDYWKKRGTKPPRRWQSAGRELSGKPSPSDLERFWAKVERGPSCWVWGGCRNNRNYGQFRVLGQCLLPHRFSYLIHYGPVKKGMCILHKCDNPKCVNPEHLRLGTMKDNTQDMISKGRSKFIQFNGRILRGEEGTKAKFTNKQAAEIRRRYWGRNATQLQMAGEFGVTQSTIWRIAHGHVYVAI